MEGMNSIRIPKMKKRYTEFVAAYVVLRENGMQHESAINPTTPFILDLIATAL
jgi:hypothetical protein